jgi:7,8-dihydropterin-6-yl-methyl-4-(beta-D-ribofuranosyl)aminobenzene 5'-phosphate synthase
MSIKATVLCENCVFHNVGAIAEHGWAVYLETKQGIFLFDTGQGKAIINNAAYFRKDLSAIQGIIISHHHVDHTGGLLPVLENIGKKKIYSHPDLFKKSYSLRGKIERYIGIPYRQVKLESNGAEFVFNRNFREIAPDMMITGEIPRKTDFEKGDKNQVIKTAEGFIKDSISDDQTLVFNTNKGLFIILGCSHAGIINILNYIIEKTGEKHIHTIIGGTHLGPADKEVREKSIQALKKFDIERIGVSHCTGLEGSARLLQEFRDRFFFCNVGTVVEV